MIQQRYHPAQVAAAAAALATSPQELLSALQQATHAKADNGPAATGPRLLTLKECASRLNVCRRTIQNLIDAGDLAAHKQGSRFVRVREADLLAFIDGMPMRQTRAARVAAQ